MEPMARPHATLVDLLDRVLDRGLILDADIIISLAGVPLIGVKLRAAVAGMETMVKYGVMQEWDQRIRDQKLEPKETLRASAMTEEEVPIATALPMCQERKAKDD